MYYLFFDKDTDINQMLKKLKEIVNSDIIEAKLKTNTILPNCICIKTSFYNDTGLYTEIKKIFNTNKFQLLKIPSRTYPLI